MEDLKSSYSVRIIIALCSFARRNQSAASSHRRLSQRYIPWKYMHSRMKPSMVMGRM